MSESGSSRDSKLSTQLLVKASFDRANGLTRRITFRDVNEVTFAALQARVIECFALSSNFKIAYKDDDGDENVIENDNDLVEALDYMRSGEDTSSRSAKCTMKIFIVLGYEGPNLSDSATFMSGRTRGSRSRWSRAGSSDSGSSIAKKESYYASDRSIYESDEGIFRQDSDNGRRRPLAYGSGDGHGRQEWDAGSWRGQRHQNDRANQLHLKEGSLDSTSDGRAELERRWFLETSRGTSSYHSQAHASTSTSSDYLASTPLQTFQVENLQKLTSVVQTHLSPDALQCSHCRTHLIDLRFVCIECGPLRYRSPSTSGRPEELDDNSPGKEARQHSQGTELSGYELCEICVESSGRDHAQSCEEAEKHVYIEAHKGLDSQGWRVVAYAPSLGCNACGAGPLYADAYRCLGCAQYDMCSACFANVQEKHAPHPFQILPPTIEASSGGSYTGPSGRSDTRRRSSVASRSSGQSSQISSKSSVHVGCFCESCGEEIVGARYSCATCPSFSLCSLCEETEEYPTDRNHMHTTTHIMLKARTPLPDAAFHQAYDRASSLASGYDGDRSSAGGRTRSDGFSLYPGHQHWQGGRPPPPPPPGPPFHGGAWNLHPPPPPWSHGPGPPGPHFGHPGMRGPWQHQWKGPPHHKHGRGPPGPPPIYLINTGQNGSQASVQQLTSLEGLSMTDAGRMNLPHNVPCSRCGDLIFGVRWLCANCPTVPSTDLCQPCEISGSASMHNYMHVWLRISVPLTRPLEEKRALLPILYQPPKAGSDRETVVGSDVDSVREDAVAVLDTATHANVLCDQCLQPIASSWYKCATCPSSPDLCEGCFTRGSTKHDSNHIYIKLVRTVNMALFKSLTGHGSPGGLRPLVTL